MVAYFAIVVLLSCSLTCYGAPFNEEKRMLLIYRPTQCPYSTCFQDPCNYSKCPKYPEAKCQYECNCRAFFTDHGGVPLYCGEE